MLCVFLTAPNHLYRHLHRLGYSHRLGDEIPFRPTSKGSPQQRGVDLDLIIREARNLFYCFHSSCLMLSGNPDFARVGGDVSGAVHRFHCGMMQKRHLVFHIQHLLAINFSLTHPFEGSPQFCVYHSTIQSLALSALELRLEGFESLLGVPSRIGHHCDTVWNQYNILDAIDGFGRGFIVGFDLSTENR